MVNFHPVLELSHLQLREFELLPWVEVQYLEIHKEKITLLGSTRGAPVTTDINVEIVM